ncbi:MAG: DNA-3-methyladenine glycosylase I [Desulfobacterales bacterium]|nr:DNA-3-methyladenine glycosylase I [Desulfobacterales bacterium]
MKKRCDWAIKTDIEKDYHDNEWGVPLHNDQKLFEFLILEGAQAGLSWITILKKRDAYRVAFDNFDVQKVAQYDDKKIAELLKNPGIIRNKLKVNAAVNNAKIFIEIQEEFGSFDKYLWSFTDYKTITNPWKKMSDVPVSTEISDIMSKDMKKRGFKFVGTIICYSLMQAVGMVNDHTKGCFRYSEIKKLS